MSDISEAKVSLCSKIPPSACLALVGAWAIYFVGPKGKKDTTIADLLKQSPVTMAELNYGDLMIGDPIGAKNKRVASYLNEQVIWEGFFEHAERHVRTDPKDVYWMMLSDRLTTLEPTKSVIADAIRARVRCSLGVEAATQLETIQPSD